MLFHSLQYLCQNFPIVDEHVREAMGDALYNLFIVSRGGYIIFTFTFLSHSNIYQYIFQPKYFE